MADPGVTWIIEGVAIVICISWIWVNAYHYYPMIATSLASIVGRGGSSDDEELSLSADELPDVDVLLPAYHEEEVIENSIASVRGTDYPQEKISLVVLVEPDDEETPAELERISDDYEFTKVTVPASYPGRPNKPRALNFGFERTDGDLVSITDAEDVVHPKLYRRVAEKLSGDGHDYVQGRLDMVNEDDGWMNVLFRAEYGYWYKVNTKAKYHQEYPIPLGGTTCFFPRELMETMSDLRLEEYGDPWTDEDRAWVREKGLEGSRPWDPNNVTEDFELGLFLWQNGYRAGYVSGTPTDEESPLSLHAWVRQRTRWKKGKIQTFLQYVRSPPETFREKAHVYSQSAVPHLGPINLTSVLVILLGANLIGYELSSVTTGILIAAFLLAMGMVGLYSYGYWAVSEKPPLVRLRRTAIVALTLPVYWFMQWLADIRALAQTYSGELHWAKTTHFGRNVNTDGGVQQRSLLGLGQTTVLSEHTRLLALVGVFVAGTALRLYDIGTWSLYGDELYSITSRGALAPAELLTVPLALDSHPPLYYLLLHYWMEAFGNSVVAARSLSVVFSVGALALMFFLGTELFDDRVGLLAAFLYAVSSFHVHYGRTARMYSLFALLTLASWYGFVRLRDDSLSSSVGYVLSTALLAYTHVFGLFVIAAQYLYLLLSETNGGIRWRTWVRTQGAVGVLTAPWLLLLGNRALSLFIEGSEGSIIGWVPRPNLGIVTHTVLRYAGWPHHYPLLTDASYARTVAAVLVLVFSACVVLALIRLRPGQGYEFTDLPKVGQLSSLVLVPIVVPFLVSYFVVPVYFPRFTTPASLGLFILVAAGIVNIARRRRRLLVIGIILICSLTLVGQYHATGTEADWEGAAACINDGASPGDAVLYQTFWTQEYVEYYQDAPGVEKFGVLSADEIDLDREYGRNLSQVRSLAGGFDRVWLLQYQPSEENRVRDALRETHDVVVAQDYGPLDVYRLERTADREGPNVSSEEPKYAERSEVARLLSTDQRCSDGSPDPVPA